MDHAIEKTTASRDRIALKNEEIRLRSQRALVTGGAGFIGSHLVDALTSRGTKVRILDNLSTGTLKNIETHLSNGSADLVRGDLRNIREVKEALMGVDAVFHLAAITSVPYSVKNPTITDQVNAKGARNLLEASANSNVKDYVFASTCAVYGDPQYTPIDEDHQLNPKSPYAESKLRGEEYCREFREKYGLKTATLRFFNVYGTRQTANQYSSVITNFITNIREGKPPIIYGDGQQTRDFVHVSDVVQALLLSANNKVASEQIFNIGSGKSVTINELCQLVLKKLKSDIKPVHREPRAGDIKHSSAKIERARRTIGYDPKVSLDKGLEELVSHQKY